MQRFWDARAEENPLWFIDTRLDYVHPDEDRFWRNGEAALDLLLGAVDAELSPDDEVLEVGCGIGRMTRALAGRSRRVIALDVSERMIALARKRNPHLEHVEWVVGDGSSLVGVRDAQVDVCVSQIVFQHIPDPSITLGYVREMGRVLRPGGWAAFQVSNLPELHRPRRDRTVSRDALAGGLRRIAGRAPRGTEQPEWLGSAIELGALEDAARAGGMEVERVENPGTAMCFVRTRRR